MSKATLIIALLATLAVTNSSYADGSARIVFLNTDSVFPKDLPFSEGVRVGNMIFLSGQIGITPGTLTLVDGGIQAEAKQTIENIRRSLEANGLSLSDIVKCTIVMADISEWSEFNTVSCTQRLRHKRTGGWCAGRG